MLSDQFRFERYHILVPGEDYGSTMYLYFSQDIKKWPKKEILMRGSDVLSSDIGRFNVKNKKHKKRTQLFRLERN